MKKKPKKREDENQAAARVVAISTGQPIPVPKRKKNPAAVALGLLGGSKGGKKRAEKLSAERRRQIASDAARARWTRERGATP